MKKPRVEERKVDERGYRKEEKNYPKGDYQYVQ